MKRWLTILLLCSSAFGATVTQGISTASTSNASSYASGSFTPAANDLLVVFVAASATVATGTMTDSQSLGFTLVTSTTWSAGANTLYVFVANNLAAASAMTVTFACTGDAATGAIIDVLRISGMSKTGASAILQSAVQANQAASTTPAPAFSVAAQTGNPTLGFVANSTNPATMTQPTGWTEQNDTGYGTPTSGAETVSRDSGFTGTTITWGSTSGSVFGDIIVELDTSLPVVATPTYDNDTGTYTTSVTVTISDGTSGATICYTEDGTTPTATVAGTCDQNTYSTPLTITTTGTVLKSIGTKSGFTNSSVKSATYTITSASGGTFMLTMLGVGGATGGGGGAGSNAGFVNISSNSNTGTNAVTTLVTGTSTCATRAYCFQLVDGSKSGNSVAVFTEWNDSAASCNASTAAAVTTTDNADTYTQGATAHDTTNHIWASVFYKIGATAGTRNMRVTFAGACTNVSAMGIQLYNTTAFNTSAGNQSLTGTTSWTSGSITAGANDMVLGYFCATNPAQNIASYTAGAGFALRIADNRDGCALEWETAAAGATNPAMTSGTSAAFVGITAAFTSGSQGTAPSGLYVASIQHHSTATSTTGPFTYQFPSVGNLLVIATQCGGTTPMVLSSVSDGSNTWKLSGTTQNGVGDGSIFYAENASSSPTLTETLTTSGTGDCSFNYYDVVGAATSNSLNARSFECADAGTLVAGLCGFDPAAASTMSPLLGQHYPGTSTSGGSVTIATTGLDFNTCIGMGAPSGSLFDSATTGGENLNGPWPVDENNCWGHFYNTDNSAQTLTWNMTSSTTDTQQSWTEVASFVSPSATLLPSQLGNTVCFSASSPFTCSYTPHRTGSLIAIGVSSTGSGTVTVTDSAGNTITAVDGPITIAFGGVMKSFYVASVNTASSDTFTITIGTGGTYQAAFIAELTNVTTLDQHNIQSTTASGGAFSTGSVTTTANNEYMFAWAMCFTNCYSAGFGASMQGLNQDAHGNYSEFRILTATGSVAANFKDSGTNAEGAAMMTFK